MQLSKEMSFLTSSPTISFAPRTVQLNNAAAVLCSDTVTHYYCISTQEMCKQQENKLKKQWLTKPQDTHVWVTCPPGVAPTFEMMHSVMLWFFSCTPESQRRRRYRKVLNDLTSQSHHLCSTACFHSLPSQTTQCACAVLSAHQRMWQGKT